MVFAFNRIWKPEIFQGRNRKSNYFEGWYYKLIDSERQNVFAVIPGISLGERQADAHAFVQVIDAVQRKSAYYRFPLESFVADPKRFAVHIGTNEFTEDRIKLDLGDGEFSADLEFDGIVKYPKSLFSPGIMGPFSFIPCMECYHGIVNISHTTRGKLIAEGININMDGGKGYIEKDWGSSFPKSWIWLQANNFEDQSVSFMFSVARIPWLKKSFTGMISFLMTREGFHKFATYNGSRIEHLELDNDILDVSIQNNKYKLVFTAEYSKGGILKAPRNGLMMREIEESITANVSLTLSNAQGIVFKGSSTNAGMEIAGDTEDILKNRNNKKKDG